MSILATKALGNVEIKEEDILNFSNGLYGFQGQYRFVLLSDQSGSPFSWLQCISEANLAFIVIDPRLFCKTEYIPIISSAELDILQIEKVSDCNIYTIVTIPHNQPKEMTANLQGPILINMKKKIGCQVISQDNNHTVRVPILQQLEG